MNNNTMINPQNIMMNNIPMMNSQNMMMMNNNSMMNPQNVMMNFQNMMMNNNPMMNSQNMMMNNTMNQIPPMNQMQMMMQNSMIVQNDDEFIGLTQKEIDENIKREEKGMTKINPLGCGMQLNWDEMEDCSDEVIEKLKEISIDDYHAGLLKISDEMKK